MNFEGRLANIAHVKKTPQTRKKSQTMILFFFDSEVTFK